jgi:hypothetical protein
MIAQGLAAGHSLWRRESAQAARGEAVEAAQTLVRGRIERLSPITRFVEGKPLADLHGSSERFEFIALPSDVERPSPLRRFTLARDPAGDLVLGGEPVRGGERQTQVLLHGVAGLEIAYFGATGADPQNIWRTDWPDQADPPRLVRVRVEFPARDPRVWPELVVQPAASVDTSCVIDEPSGACKGRS